MRESVYATTRTIKKASKYIKDKIITTEVYICPRCSTDLPHAAHAVTTRCDNCKLYIVVLGASMEIWE